MDVFLEFRDKCAWQREDTPEVWRRYTPYSHLICWASFASSGGRWNWRKKVFPNRSTAVSCSSGNLADAQFLVE